MPLYRGSRYAIFAPSSPYPSWLLSAGGVPATLDIDFVNDLAYNAGTSSIASLLSCTRASAGYYTKADGTLQNFSSNNTLRYGTNGLLVEESRTNIALQSQAFDNGGSWTYSVITVTPNAASAPDLTTTADKLVSSSTSNSSRQAYQIGKTLFAASYTGTCYFKKAEAVYGIVNIYDGSDHRTWFNLNTGTVGTSDAGNTGSITALANGWYRCAVTRTAASTANGGISIEIAETDGSYNNISGNGVYAWGAQLEAGSFATSYIPTTGSSATRAADSISFSDTAWLNTAAASLYGEGNAPTAAASGVLLCCNNGSNLSAGGNTSGFYYSGAVLVSATRGGSALWATGGKLAAALSGSNIAVCMNNGTVATNAAAANLSSSSVFVGQNSGASGQWNGYITRLAAWNVALSNANLQSLTT